MVIGLAADEGMIAGREVEPLHDAKAREDVQRPEDRRPPQPESLGARPCHEIVRGEVAPLVRDHAGQDPPRCGQAVAGTAEGLEDGSIAWHG